jgi:hypothetical protein
LNQHPEPKATESTEPAETTTAKVDQTEAAVATVVDQEPASKLAVTTDSAGAVSTDGADSEETASQQIFKDLVNKLKELWQKVASMSSSEQKPNLTIVAIVVLVILSLILAAKILEIVDNAPLLEPFFELVGIGYSIWFVWRYLLFANTRQELVENVKGIKSKILG